MSKELDQLFKEIHSLNKQILILDKKYSKEILEIKNLIISINQNIEDTLEQIQDFNELINQDPDDNDEWNPYNEYEAEDYETYGDQIEDENWSDNKDL
jgi:hypothetical protein